MRRLIVMHVHVAAGRDREFEGFVAERAQVHERAKGFERMYLLRTDDRAEWRLVSWWRDTGDLEPWIRKEIYALSEDPAHHGIVVGPVPYEVLEIVRQFEAAAVGNA